MESLKIFSGSSHVSLANAIAKNLNVDLGKILIKHFADREIFVQLEEAVRGKDVFLIQPTCNPANHNLMELLIITDALKRSSAKRITAVIPYFGYARQDRKDRPHVPITSKLVVNLITASGSNRVITMDLHAAQIQGFFDIPVDHLTGFNVFSPYFNTIKNIKEYVFVAPDPGAIFRSRLFATYYNTDLAIIDKRRAAHNVSEVLHIIGDIKDRNVVIIDDIVDTAGTLCNAAGALKKHGARDVYACITHAVLSGDAVDKINHSDIKELIITDTIPVKKHSKKIRVLTVAKLFAEAIYHIHIEKSLGDLFLE